jgi:dihydrofolate synthase/folylpolyglutamate synthase
MEYSHAIAALESAIVFGVNPSLDGIRALTDELGRPQDSFASVQVTGTNGKSSTTRMIAALLTAEGVATGTFTSPHLEAYTERIELDGVPVSEDDFALAMAASFDASAEIGAALFDLTEFELLTAAALWLMRERDVAVACLEVGMGGLWDATSVVDPAVAVITGVGLDHTERLGPTVEAIAADKASIIKAGASVVLGPGTAEVAGIFLERAASLGLHPRFVAEGGAPSPVSHELTVRYEVVERPSRPGGALRLDVRGIHGEYTGLELTAPGYQAQNVATAVAAAECMLGRALQPEAVREALAAIRFPGRFELVVENSPIVLDGAHNPQAAAVLATAVAEAWPTGERPWCVLGVLADKDVDGIVTALAPAVAGFFATQPDVARALNAGVLAARVAAVTGVWPEILPDLRQAIPFARAFSGEAGLLVTGSLYTVGEARAFLRS